MRFRGDIAGVGSTSGVRIVIGRWPSSPFGDVADVMVETAAGHRVLLAPDPALADFVAATYHFDEIRIEPVSVGPLGDHGRQVTSPSLRLRITVGGPTLLGRLIAVVPRRWAESPTWCALTDPIARVALRGVRTRGTAGGGRREWYGATRVRGITAMSGSFDGADLGRLAPVDPPCRFGFSSTPARPSVTEVCTTIELPGDG
ncbi:hypothetical protein [Nocardioides sambongensis]|uniref:hypothetical protein n=1 Tax=Nocardioides sambongensis TaxID=2589074 RepID=UPI0018C88761|nr:hypothetical protein [Nocardioides sambongensis]